jgi:hypothetical protein
MYAREADLHTIKYERGIQIRKKGHFVLNRPARDGGVVVFKLGRTVAVICIDGADYLAFS